MLNLDYSSQFEIKKFTNKDETESPNHSHPYFELVYVRQANFNYFIEDTLYQIADKNIVFINKNTIHKAIFKNKSKCVYFVVKFYEKCITKELLYILDELFSKKTLVLTDSDFLLIDLMFSKMHHEYEDKKENWDVLVNLQLNELIVLLNRLASQTTYTTPKIYLQEIKNVIEYINDNATAPISELSLEKLAHKFFMTPSHLSRQFKKQVEIGFKEYVILSKIVNAKTLMQTTDLSITEISYSCGFNDSNYFSTVFKKKEGVSPSTYMKAINKN